VPSSSVSCSSRRSTATLSTTNPTWTDLRLSPYLCGEMKATYSLNHGTVPLNALVFIYFTGISVDRSRDSSVSTAIKLRSGRPRNGVSIRAVYKFSVTTSCSYPASYPLDIEFVSAVSKLTERVSDHSSSSSA
jgi:hypothetical protein